MNKVDLLNDGDYLRVVIGGIVVANVKADENAHAALQRVFDAINALEDKPRASYNPPPMSEQERADLRCSISCR